MRFKVLALALLAAALAHSPATGQIMGYGVNSNGDLFNFDVDNTATTTTIGNLGFVPDAIDFRPGTYTLYAIDVGRTTTQLYTIDILTGTATAVGAGFATTVSGQPSGNYDLSGAIGFDFNPRTLQVDGSIRIRVVASNGTNLRLNSDTGLVAAVDTPLDYPDADPNAAAVPSVDAAAYINSGAATMAAGGTTTLFVLDSGTDDLSTQSPPNDGQLNTIGTFGVGVDANAGIGFDIFSLTTMDDTIADDRAFAVLTRPDGPVGNVGAYLLYDVDLASGATTGGRLVGGGLDFAGGFAVIPEPSTWTLFVAGGLFVAAAARRRLRSA